MTKDQWLALKRRECIVTSWDRYRARVFARGEVPPGAPYDPPPRRKRDIREDAAQQLAKKFAALRRFGWVF